MLARALFTAMDLAYGRTRTIVKFTMLEFIARVPYQAWERMGYLALARYRGRSTLARGGYSGGSSNPVPSRTTSNGTCSSCRISRSAAGSGSRS
jgi:hypothetical protein